MNATYTAEQLREWANNKAVGSLLADQLRAHADALEENARLKAERDEYRRQLGIWNDATPTRAERAEAELADHARWLDEMVADYRLMADPHTESKRLAINALIHDQRAELAKLRQHAEAMYQAWESVEILPRDNDARIIAACDAYRADFPEEK